MALGSDTPAGNSAGSVTWWPTRGLIMHLRDLYEHCEKERDVFPAGQTGSKFSSAFPGATPWSLVWHPGGHVMLGGVLELGELESTLQALDEALGEWQQRIAAEEQR